MTWSKLTVTVKKKYEPSQVNLSSQEAEDLKQRIQDRQLTDKDIKILLGLIAFNHWMQKRLGRAKLTIKRLKKLFGFKSESQKKSKKTDEEKKAASDQSAQEPEVDPSATPLEINAGPDSPPEELPHQNKITITPNWDPQKNHGRYAANDYPGCPITHFYLDNEHIKAGQCPECAEHLTYATLTKQDPVILVFLKSQPLVSGDRYSFERVRCNVCETYFTAKTPDYLVDQMKYSYACSTTIAISHYYSGLPFKRIEMLQRLQGVPLADSTQYDLMKQFYNSVIKPVISIFIQQAADGKGFFFDDTTERVLDQMAQNKKANSIKDKKSVHTTAMLSEYQGNLIYLFNTNTLTAGKQFAELIKHRRSDEKFITMSDASPHNFPELEDNLLARWIISLCLSHSRRRFVELLDDADDDIKLILDIIGRVYHNEKHCKKEKFNDQQRLEYHKTHSESYLLALHCWLNNLLLYKQVEPNSRLGEAIVYLLKRWIGLTQFLRVPGAALDNNICEQAIKVVIRYRKNSLFYKSFYGATVGDAIMSVLHTAASANINIFDYLNTLQEHANEVNASPENWLPWNYQKTVDRIDNTTAQAA